MDKVKLPREDCKELDRLKMANPTYWKQHTLKMYLDHVYTFTSTFETILEAMVNGYEVEETPEDKVRALYLQHRKSTGEYHRGFMNGMVSALQELNISDILNGVCEGGSCD